MDKSRKIKLPVKRYYREWMAEFGYGVSMGYDTVLASSKKEAESRKPTNMYSYDKSFELVIPVETVYLKLSDEELAKIYGV